MTLMEKIKAATDIQQTNREEGIKDIINFFKDRMCREQFEDYLYRICTKREAKTEKRTNIYFETWGYHSGCSGTHIVFGNILWKNPDIDEYDYDSRYYKGWNIENEGDKIWHKLNVVFVEKLQELGFCVDNSFLRKNNISYNGYITISW